MSTAECKHIISKQTEQDVHFANVSKQNARVKIKKKKKKGVCHKPKISGEFSPEIIRGKSAVTLTR